VSKVIHNPTLASVEEHSATSATFVVEPLHTGYGMTLGNSLRRVLLSSITGASITAFRVEGATHEFTTIPGVKEDVVDIMLNLKGINFTAHNEEPVELRLEKKGSGVVTAGDIDWPSDLDRIEEVAPKGVAAGDRYHEAGMRTING
jgi:DNA-directed RNA polymerase subunit alpha